MARAVAAGFILLMALSGASPPQIVSVLYAGSLVTPMEGPVSQALATRGVTFQGEGRGSQEIANFIEAGLRKPDVVIVVDPAILTRLTRAGYVAQSWPLGSGALGIGWSDRSRLAARLARTPPTRDALLALFATPNIKIARTDPQLDPKGKYTIEAMQLLFGAAQAHAILGSDENPAQIFPEESLLVQLETGEADLGFLYSTEARARRLNFLELPGSASLSNKIRYSIAIMKNAPHPAVARAFVDFLLHGAGHRILLESGLQ